MRRLLSATLLLLFTACILAAPAQAAPPQTSGDVNLVLAVAKGETDAARRDGILRYGARYAKSAADRAALLSAMTPEAAKALSPTPEKCPSCDGTGQGILGKPCPQCHGAGWTGPFRTAVSGNPFACDMCRGTGEMFPGKVCPKCHGSGMTGPMKVAERKSLSAYPDRCASCDGTGRDPMGRTCPVCHGSGMTGPMKSKVMAPRCDLCNGTGELYPGHTCPGCHGSGWPMVKSDAKGAPATAKALDPNPVKCPSCNGTGRTALGKPCFQCHGAGMTGPMRVWQDNPFQCGMCGGTGSLFPGKLCPLCHGSGVPGPMRAKTPALHDRALERLVKARLLAKENGYDKALLAEILRVREESRAR